MGGHAPGKHPHARPIAARDPHVTSRLPSRRRFIYSLLNALLILALAWRTLAFVIGRNPNNYILPEDRAPLQDIVTWDDKSIFVNGERVLLYSGEFHPFRLPVPGLWLDVLQKIKALGYNTVSIYVDWALLEGKPGDFTAEGVFAWEPFFEAAKEAGIYILARPGPYINAEVSGGGFPGWLQRVKGILRSGDGDFLESTDNYVRNIGAIVAAAQITNGGPVILVQPENEYSQSANDVPFPDVPYWNRVVEQYRDAGIVVPLINNEASIRGLVTPTTPAEIDIYGHDGYPLGFDCANPTVWPDGNLPSNWWQRHLEVSPSTPYSIIEFQGGAFDPWGGNGFDKCVSLINQEFARVFYKNNYAYGVTIFNIYMTYGGTNWGNLGHPGGYTSYDYGAIISESRGVARERYSEVKLQATFLQSTPAYLTADRLDATTDWTTSADITIIPAADHTSKTKFYFTRHTRYNTLDSTSYKLRVSTARYGNLTVPQLDGSLSLNGRDAKVHVSDYKAGDFNIVYSTAEIFTWKKYGHKTVLIVYGGPNEQHELAIENTRRADEASTLDEGSEVTIESRPGYSIYNWVTSSDRKIIKTSSNLYIYLLNRNEAYNYWVAPTQGDFNQGSIVLKAGYLIRNAEVHGNSLQIVGDINATTTLEVIGGAPRRLEQLKFNGEDIGFEQNAAGVVTALIEFKEPSLDIPDLGSLDWKYIDSLPEIQTHYSDDDWQDADLEQTYNDLFELETPTSLFGGDYGFHAGSLVFRGHFTAHGNETTFELHAQGGSAYGHSAWLGETFLGSWVGNDRTDNYVSKFELPKLKHGKKYVITVVIDHMGQDGNFTPGNNSMKRPRGILNYSLSGRPQSAIHWKITGNLGGEDYVDRARGPFNEGGLFVERQGFHLPYAPTDEWNDSDGPTAGIQEAGIGYFATSFDLDMPSGYDIPLSFVFANETVSAYRVQLYVNGYQFGKYVHHVGPQDRYPVPEGILNYHGTNWVGLTLWAMEAEGAKVEKIDLVPDAIVRSGFGEVELSPQPGWEERDAY